MAIDLGDVIDIVVPKLKSAHFAVTITGEEALLRAGFNQCSGLGVGLQTHTVEETGSDTQSQFPLRVINRPVTLIRGLDIQGFFFRWLQQAKEWEPDRPDYRKDVTIYQLQRINDNAAVARRAWDLFGAFPLEWKGPTFNSMGDDLAFEEVTLHYASIDETPLFTGAVVNTDVFELIPKSPKFPILPLERQ